jgi:hypothetical protein
MRRIAILTVGFSWLVWAAAAQTVFAQAGGGGAGSGGAAAGGSGASGAASAGSNAGGAAANGIGASGGRTPGANSGTSSNASPNNNVGSGAASVPLGSGTTNNGPAVTPNNNLGSGAAGSPFNSGSTNGSTNNPNLGNSNLGAGGTNAAGTFQGQGSATGNFDSAFPGQSGANSSRQNPAGAAGALSNTDQNGTGDRIGQGRLGGEIPSNNRNNTNDNWRWRFFNGMWWYWMPKTSQWMYYQNSSWQTFNGPVEGISSTQSQMQTPYSTGYRGTNMNSSVGAGGQTGNVGTSAAGTAEGPSGQPTTGTRDADKNDRSGTEGIPPNVDNGPEMPKQRAGAGTAAAGGVRLK